MFLTAPDPKGLVRLMLSNNLQFGKEFSYFDITHDGKNWFVWFYDIVTVTPDMILPKSKGKK